MNNLLQLLPNKDMLLALTPEELGIKFISVVKAEHGQGMFYPLNYLPEYSSETVYKHDDKRLVHLAFLEAINWLKAQGLIIPEPGINGDNGYCTLSRQALAFESDQEAMTFARGLMLKKDLLHPSLAQSVWMSFLRQEYDVAIFQSMKQVEVAVRDAADLASTDIIGVQLMQKAFHPDTGPLTDKNLPHAERKSVMFIFSGAIGAFKNPQSHRTVGINEATEAYGIVMLASHLLRMLDKHIRAQSTSSGEVS